MKCNFSIIYIHQCKMCYVPALLLAFKLQPTAFKAIGGNQFYIVFYSAYILHSKLYWLIFNPHEFKGQFKLILNKCVFEILLVKLSV